MEMIKCDRCGKITENPLFNYGITPFYTGRVNLYQYSDIPGFSKQDLCQKCQGKLDEFVNDFMEKKQGI